MNQLKYPLQDYAHVSVREHSDRFLVVVWPDRRLHPGHTRFASTEEEEASSHETREAALASEWTLIAQIRGIRRLMGRDVQWLVPTP